MREIRQRISAVTDILGRPPRVMVVDDEPDCLDFVCEGLTIVGFTNVVRYSCTSAAATAGIVDAPYDLVLSDLQNKISGDLIGGFTLFDTLTAAGKRPIVYGVMTGSYEDHFHLPQVEAMEGYYAKPFRITEVIGSLTDTLYEKVMRSELLGK